MTTTNPLSLEGMAAEIKTIILLKISDLPSLSAMLRASPHMYAVYATDRNKFLSSIVLPTLASRGLDLTKPANVIELYSHQPDQNVFVPTVHSWYSQLSIGASRPGLTIKVARSLLHIALAVTWCLEPGPGPSKWLSLSRPQSPVLPQPRPNHLCIVGIVPARKWALPSVMELLSREGYRISGVKIKGGNKDIRAMATAMTLEPYDPEDPEK